MAPPPFQRGPGALLAPSVHLCLPCSGQPPAWTLEGHCPPWLTFLFLFSGGAQDDGFWARGMKLMSLRPAGWRQFVISTQPSAKSQKVLQPASPSGPCLCGDACRLRAEQGGRRQGNVNSLLSHRKGRRSGSFELKWRQACPFHPFAV